jgi:selenide, water dikinase
MMVDESSGGGCARKLPSAMLDNVLQPLSSVIGRIPVSSPVNCLRDLGDACRVRLIYPVDELVTTADMLYPVSDDPEVSGYIAGVHALSDLFATFSQPIYGTVTLGTTPSDVGAGYASKLLGGVAEALHNHGAVVAGGHSIVTSESFVNVAVTGRVQANLAVATVKGGDVIVLWKRLGTGLALTARKLGVATEDELAEEYDSMRESNESAAKFLITLGRDSPGAVRAVCDVSGFGFLNALRHVAGSAVAEVVADQIPHFTLSETLVDQQCWSALADANLLASQDYTSYEQLDPSRGFVPSVLNDPQTSGGLLAVVSAEAWRDSIAAPNARVVGSIVEPSGGPRVIVRRETA